MFLFHTYFVKFIGNASNVQVANNNKGHTHPIPITPLSREVEEEVPSRHLASDEEDSLFSRSLLMYKTKRSRAHPSSISVRIKLSYWVMSHFDLLRSTYTLVSSVSVNGKMMLE